MRVDVKRDPMVDAITGETQQAGDATRRPQLTLLAGLRAAPVYRAKRPGNCAMMPALSMSAISRMSAWTLSYAAMSSA